MKQKNIIKYLAILLILGIIILAVCLIMNNSKQDEKIQNLPEDKLKLYMSYIEENNYDKMYDLISESSKSSINKEDFVSRNENIYKAIEAKNIEISNIEEIILENRWYKTFI